MRGQCHQLLWVRWVTSILSFRFSRRVLFIFPPSWQHSLYLQALYISHFISSIRLLTDQVTTYLRVFRTRLDDSLTHFPASSFLSFNRYYRMMSLVPQRQETPTHLHRLLRTKPQHPVEVNHRRLRQPPLLLPVDSADQSHRRNWACQN